MPKPTDAPKAPQLTEGELENKRRAAARRLYENLDELVTEVHPKVVVHQATEEAKQFAATQFAEVKEQVKDQYGWRVDRLALIGGAVVGAVVFVLVVRAITHRGAKD